MRQRIKRLRAELRKLGIDAFLVAERSVEPVYIRYLAGSPVEGLLYINQKDSYLVTDGRYKEKAEKEAKVSEVIIASPGPRYFEALAQKAILKPGQGIGIEGRMPVSAFQRLQEIFPSNEFIVLKDFIDDLAIVKDRGEIARIKKALEITEKVFKKHILPQVQPGITERDLAAEISYWGKKYGVEKDAFDIIVAAGSRSSLPHGYVTSEKLEIGDLVQFDFGYVIDGYPSDFSRVVVLGEPSEKQKEIYQIVLIAQEMAIKEARPGMKCKDLDKVARDYIKSKGYDIPHALGHGLGIRIHSAPRVGPGEETELKPGYLVTIEPGIYIPDWGGIRIEDVIVITKDGCQNLTKFQKNLIIK